MAPAIQPEYYCVNDVARLLSISEESARRLVLSLPHLRIGRSIRVRIEVIEAFRSNETIPGLESAQSNKTLMPTTGRFLLQ
jgi:hypothetical protein